MIMFSSERAGIRGMDSAKQRLASWGQVQELSFEHIPLWLRPQEYGASDFLFYLKQEAPEQPLGTPFPPPAPVLFEPGGSPGKFPQEGRKGPNFLGLLGSPCLFLSRVGKWSGRGQLVFFF